MWKRYGNIWVMQEMPIITVEPFLVLEPKKKRSQHLWKACCGGRPVEQIEPGTDSAEVMRRTEQYYDARIELSPAERRR